MCKKNILYPIRFLKNKECNPISPYDVHPCLKLIDSPHNGLVLSNEFVMLAILTKALVIISKSAFVFIYTSSSAIVLQDGFCLIQGL